MPENRRMFRRRGTYLTLRPAQRRGFTLVELGVSVLVFSVLAGFVTLAVARVQLSGATDRVRRAVESELRDLAAIAGTGTFDELVAGTFPRPVACDDIPADSCVTILDRPFRVSWTIEGVLDRVEYSTERPAGVQITAATSMPDGTVVTAKRFVASPGAGSDDDALVRVRMAGAERSGPVYLVDADGAVVASASTVGSTATLRAAAADCPEAAPCRLALRPDGSTRDDDVTFDYETAAGTRAAVTVTAGAVVEKAAVLIPVAELHVLLLAENADGRRAWASEPGTVCLHLHFAAVGGTVDIPGCNTETADRIVFRTWNPDPADPLVEVAVPPATTLTVATDPADGTCNTPDQLAYTGTSWAAAAVCTSWTWGSIGELRPGSTGLDAALTEPTIRFAAGAATYTTAVWTGDSAPSPGIPAAGQSGGPLWEKPRTRPGCADTGTCTPTVTDPEAACPQSYCQSAGNDAPVLLAPRRGTYKTPGATLGPSTVTLSAADPDGGPVAVKVTSIVNLAITIENGTDQQGEPVVVDVDPGDTIATAASPVSVDVGVTLGQGAARGTFTVELSDGTATRTETIVVDTSNAAATVAELLVGPIRVRQNSAAVGRVSAVGSDGNPYPIAAATATLPSGVLAAPPVTGGTGWATFTVTAGAAPVTENASYTYTVGGVSAAAPISVSPSPALVSLGNVTVGQGGQETVTATVTDAAGTPHAGTHVWFTVDADVDGVFPLGVRFRPRGCVTGQIGTCSVTVMAERAATTGPYTATVASATAQATVDLTIETTVARLLAPAVTVEQGFPVDVDVYAYDGRDEPSAGTVLTATTGNATITSPRTTNGAGKATFTLTTTNSTPTGLLPIIVSDGTVDHTVTIRVAPTVATIDPPAAQVTIAQRGTANVTVTARSPQGQPVPYARLNVTSSALNVPRSVTTDATGTAVIGISVDAGTATGNRSILIGYRGDLKVTVPVTVVAGVASVTATGTLTAGTPGAVRLTLRDTSGQPLPGRSVRIAADDPRMTVTPTQATSAAGGTVDLTVNPGTLPAGLQRLVVTVDGRQLTVSVTIGAAA